MISFSAALLAGGQSKRMGHDKALIQDPVSGDVFWQRQLRILEELHSDEILWSGTARDGLPNDIRVVEDVIPQAGPLAGLGACPNIFRTDLLVVWLWTCHG